MIEKKSPRDEMVLEVIEAAHNRVGKKDFDLQCKITPPTNGKSYFDRVKVFEKLITDKVIEIDDGRLRLATSNIPNWLYSGLKGGSETSWEIFEKLNPSNKVLEKIDRSLLEEIGLDGEKFVLDYLTKTLPQECHKRLKHVSLYDDSAGYDIQSPSVIDTNNTLLLEVKTSSRPGSIFNFFISRNEARIASLNNNWSLVAVLKKQEQYEIIGFLSYEQFSSYLPINISPNCQWESARIKLPINAFKQGLP